MKTTALTLSLAIALAACGGEMDEPTEAPVAGEAEASETDAASESDEKPTEDESAKAETDAEDPEKSDDQAKADAMSIPARFHGKWDTPDSDCAEFDYSESRTNISAKQITYVESSVEVEKVRAEGKDVIVDGKMYEPGDGPMPQVAERLTLVTTPQGVRLHITDGTKPKADSDYPLKRCD